MATIPATSAILGSSQTGEEAVRELERVLGETMPVLIRQGRESFRRESAELLRLHPGKWVAYSGEERLGLGESKTELHVECLRRGLKPDQFLVLRVEPEIANDIDVPVDV